MAHKKGVGSSKNGRESESKRLGVKIFGGQEYEMQRLTEIDERNRKQNLKLIRSRSLGVAVTQIVFGFGLAAGGGLADGHCLYTDWTDVSFTQSFFFKM